MTLFLVVILAVVLGAALGMSWWRRTAQTEVDRFHRARSLTTSWSAEGEPELVLASIDGSDRADASGHASHAGGARR